MDFCFIKWKSHFFFSFSLFYLLVYSNMQVQAKWKLQETFKRIQPQVQGCHSRIAAIYQSLSLKLVVEKGSIPSRSIWKSLWKVWKYFKVRPDPLCSTELYSVPTVCPQPCSVTLGNRNKHHLVEGTSTFTLDSLRGKPWWTMIYCCPFWAWE